MAIQLRPSSHLSLVAALSQDSQSQLPLPIFLVLVPSVTNCPILISPANLKLYGLQGHTTCTVPQLLLHLEKVKVKRQTNGFDCGVYVMSYVDTIVQEFHQNKRSLQQTLGMPSRI